MEIKLTAQERIDLQKRHKKERDGRVRDRIKAVLAYNDGYSYSEIARLLLLDDETIRRHIKKYFSEKILAPQSGGSDSYLSETQSVTLTAHLEEKTYLYIKDICAYVHRQFGILYSISGLRQWLQAQGFRYKKPHGVPAKAELAKQEIFEGDYAELKSQLPQDEVIFFGDSVHPSHQTKLAYGWIKKGVRKAEKMTACQKRVNLIGAININSHAIVTKQVDWVNCESLKGFAQKLIESNPETKTIHLILDNAGYHKSKEFTEWIANSKIKIHYLPPYSPNLNPIERLWKIMHEKVTYNQYYEKFACFKKAILSFFENISAHASIIKSRITDNFQKLAAT